MKGMYYHIWLKLLDFYEGILNWSCLEFREISEALLGQAVACSKLLHIV